MTAFLKQYLNAFILIGSLVAVSAGVLGVRAYNNNLREQGREEIRAQHRIDAAVAKAKQAGQNDAATKETIITETVIETQYRDRIKEVIRYVPTPGTVCPADPEFVRLFNSADR